MTTVDNCSRRQSCRRWCMWRHMNYARRRHDNLISPSTSTHNRQRTDHSTSMFKEWRCSLAFVPFVSGSLLLQGIASSQFPQLALEACKCRTGWAWGALYDQEITRGTLRCIVLVYSAVLRKSHVAIEIHCQETPALHRKASLNLSELDTLLEASPCTVRQDPAKATAR